MSNVAELYEKIDDLTSENLELRLKNKELKSEVSELSKEVLRLHELLKQK